MLNINDWKISDFEEAFRNADEVESSIGFFDESRKRYDLTWAGIASVLIKEAASRCGRYASDLLYDCRSVQNAIENNEVKDGLRLFGFRECGVDETDIVIAKLAAPSVYGKNPYKSVWGLGFETSDGGKRLRMSLRKICDADETSGPEVRRMTVDLRPWSSGYPCLAAIEAEGTVKESAPDDEGELSEMLDFMRGQGICDDAEFEFIYETDSEFPAEMKCVMTAREIRMMRYKPQYGFTPNPPTETTLDERKAYVAEIFSNAEKGVAETFAVIIETIVEILNKKA